MDTGLSPEDEAFRQQVRTFLREKLPEDIHARWKESGMIFPDKPDAVRWQKILHEQGWIAPNWPLEHGGTGWTTTQKYIFETETASYGAPPVIPLGLRMVGPVIMKYGTPEQKAHFLPRILATDDYWCQGYSEPGSGSDLASLKTRAVADGDDYVVNGSKIWTTHAQFADWMFCLVRTSDEPKRQNGITFLLIPMDTPGVDVRPIITLGGHHEVNQVFLDDVRVPQSNRVGPEGDGWTVECVYTPGHTSNHMCFALKEEKALFTGDHVMGWSTSVIGPPDGDMTAYMESLEKLQQRDDQVYWPTHGTAIREVQPLSLIHI